MPLKDRFAKAPEPLPPSEEPWPKPLAQEGVLSHSKSSDSRHNYKSSPLYSATARPTLDEFLRTNYLMIPEFVMQVNQAKQAAGIEGFVNLGVQCFQNTTSQQRVVNFREETLETPSVFSADRNQVMSRHTKGNKAVDKQKRDAGDSTATVGILGNKTCEKPSPTVTEKLISSEGIQIPPPLKPKPRVKKVMKGGSLVTIPAPQPRNRSVHTAEGYFESSDTVCSVLPRSIETTKNAVMSEKSGVNDTVNESSVKDLSDNRSGMKGDSSIFHHKASDLQEEVRTKGNKNLQSEVVAESKNEVLHDGFQNPCTNASKARSSSKDEVTDVLPGGFPQVKRNNEPDGACGNDLKEDPTKYMKRTPCEPRSTSSKVSFEEGKEDLINLPAPRENIVSEVLVKEPVEKLAARKLPVCVKDKEETKVTKDPIREADHTLGDSFISYEEKTKDSEMNKFIDLPNDLCSIGSNKDISCYDRNKKGEYTEEANNFRETDDENNKHVPTDLCREGHKNTGIMEEESSSCNNDDDVTDVEVEGCNVRTAQTDVSERQIDSDSNVGNIGKENINDDVGDNNDDGNDVNDVDYGNDDGHDDSDDDGNGDDDGGGSDGNNDGDSDGFGVNGDGGDGIKHHQSVEESDEDYAELVMEDSNSEEEDKDDFIPGNGDDSDEEEGEVQSDYEPEDMNLDSDTESATGGITYFHDTTLRKSRNRSRRRQREKRKAKNQRKKASRKRAKAEKQPTTESNRLCNDPCSKTKNGKQTQMPAHTSRKSEAKEESKNLGPQTHKTTEVLLKPQGDMPASQNKPTGQSAMEDGSLLSMVSSYAVDVTVAASEKLALKRSRGGQHAKKLKKAKRKAAALERKRRGEPPPRARRVQTPKPLCNYYIEGKCRRGEECSFRHDRSALVKRKEMCKFYASNSCFQGDDCPYMHSSFPCKFFHTGATCWAADQCKFSHDPLTEETSRLLHSVLNPPAGDPARLAEDKNLPNAGSETPGNGEQLTAASACSEDFLQVSASSPYNLRATTRKRRLSTGGAGDHVTDGKTSRQESPGHEHEANHEGQSSLFVPGLYKDLSM